MSLNLGRFNPNVSAPSDLIQVKVAWVGHNATIGDAQEEGVLESIIPESGRNFFAGGFSLSALDTGVINNIIIPQEVMGSFKLPQVGDIIWVRKSRRLNNNTVMYQFSSYSTTDPETAITPPQWGSMHGDYGHLRSHRDHNSQFRATAQGADFVTKYVRSITGYRFRRYYRSNLEQGKFVVRGDPVFDLSSADSSKEYLINTGSHLIEGGDLEEDKGKYPDPLNVPEEREKNEKYSYISVVYEPLEEPLSPDTYDYVPRQSEKGVTLYKSILKNKNYMSYQPVMDKEYLDDVKFERELPAAEEYQVALRGNNKLLIQDQYGDGEQLLITLKNQYDSQFTIVHNGERGQVRVRDHLGQGVLLDADPEEPRVILWTANRQVIEQGGIKDVGEFTYIRNGSVFGDAQTSFGRETGVEKQDVSNQEFLMVSTPDIIGELSSRLSAGMNSLVTSKSSPGVYIRNNVDPDSTSQEWAMYQMDAEMSVMTRQENTGHEGSVQSTLIEQKMDGDAVTQTLELVHEDPALPNKYTETITASSSGVSKVSTLDHSNGSGTITTTESISDSTDPTVTRITENEDGDRVILTESLSGVKASYDVFSKNSQVARWEMTADNVKTSKYASGSVVSNLIQDEGSITVNRVGIGSGYEIKIGADGGTGDITIGNSSGNTNVLGKAVTVTAASVDFNQG